jgi:hypothetical protein
MKRLLHRITKNLEKQSQSSFNISVLYSLTFIALISIKFDLDFKFHLAEMGIFNFPFIWHLTPILQPF